MTPHLRLPATMRQAVAENAQGQITIRTVPLPEPGPGEVLVRMAAAPVNPSDLARLDNSSGTPRSYPILLGREGSGRVVAAGAGPLPALLKGRRVACAPRDGGTWGEYTVVKATNAFPLKKSLSLEEGCSLLVNPLTVFAIFEIASRHHHQALVSTAAGGALGRMVLRMGLRRRLAVIHVVRKRAQLEGLRSLGAAHVLLSSDPDFVDHLRDLASNLQATLLLDAVGGDLTHQLVQAAPHGSTILVYGNLSGQDLAAPTYPIINHDLRLEGFFLGNWVRKRGVLRITRALLKVQDLVKDTLATPVHSRYLLTEIDQAVQHARTRGALGKALLVLDPREVDVDSPPERNTP